MIEMKTNEKELFLRACLNERKKIPLDGIKCWEFAIQQAIESLFPNTAWYTVTKVSIFNELLSGKMPVTVCEMVWKDVETQLQLNKENKKNLNNMISEASKDKSALCAKNKNCGDIEISR